jgi:hypothetical protein
VSTSQWTTRAAAAAAAAAARIARWTKTCIKEATVRFPIDDQSGDPYARGDTGKNL